jgi:hypothetical protein
MAQSIKSKATVIDGGNLKIPFGKKTKTNGVPVSGGGFSSGNDGDNDHGYVTAHEGEQLNDGAPCGSSPVTVNRSWWQPRKIEKFMMCSDGGDVLEKASKRALGLRSQKK